MTPALPIPDRSDRARCPWCESDPLYVAYHDTEWGVPVNSDRTHFEFLILEGAQAGLSWLTVLKRREGYQKAFSGFDPEAVARFSTQKQTTLLKNPEIIRNRLKVGSAVKNARAFLNIREEFGSFNEYVWRFVDGKPVQNHWKRMKDVPASTPRSDALSRDLKNRGMSFVGSTIIYAYMQACGLVNDHLTFCFRHQEIAGKNG